MASMFQRAGMRTGVVMAKMNHIGRRTFTSNSTNLKSVYNTVRHHPNTGLKYMGGAGAVALGGYVAYSLSRPASYVPSSTRDLMSAIGGPKFAQMVRNRIAKTYAYLGGSVLMTGATTFIMLSRGMHYVIWRMFTNYKLQISIHFLGVIRFRNFFHFQN